MVEIMYSGVDGCKKSSGIINTMQNQTKSCGCKRYPAPYQPTTSCMYTANGTYVCDNATSVGGGGGGGGTNQNIGSVGCPSFYTDCYKSIKSDPGHPQRRLEELRYPSRSDTNAVNGIVQRSGLHGAPW